MYDDFTPDNAKQIGLNNILFVMYLLAKHGIYYNLKTEARVHIG